jgi:hypothetical protein
MRVLSPARWAGACASDTNDVDHPRILLPVWKGLELSEKGLAV